MLRELGRGVKGPGFWERNCSRLEDLASWDELANKIMLWRIEGERELSELSISLGLSQVQYENPSHYLFQEKNPKKEALERNS